MNDDVKSNGSPWVETEQSQLWHAQVQAALDGILSKRRNLWSSARTQWEYLANDGGRLLVDQS